MCPISIERGTIFKEINHSTGPNSIDKASIKVFINDHGHTKSTKDPGIIKISLTSNTFSQNKLCLSTMIKSNIYKTVQEVRTWSMEENLLKTFPKNRNPQEMPT